MQDLTVTLLQTTLHWQDAAANRAHFDGLIADISTPTDLVVLPETFTTGFSMDAPGLAETMDGPSVEWLQLVARDYGITICGSLIIKTDGKFYNRLIWASPDGEIRHYDKRHLFKMAGEQEHFTPGSHRHVFEINGWRVRPQICYDLRFPVWIRGPQDYDLLLFVANWPASRISAWNLLLPARAVENLCYTVGLNRTGTDGNDVRYVGDSAIYDFLGRSMVELGDTENRIETVTLSGDALLRYRKKFPAAGDADAYTLDE